MSPTLEFALQAYATVMVMYLSINSIFRYHPTMNRLFFGAIIGSLFIVVLLLDPQHMIYFTIGWITLLVLLLLAIGFSIYKKTHGFILFYVFKENTAFIDELYAIVKEKHQMNVNQIKYNKQIPFYISFHQVEWKQALLIQKDIEKLYKAHINPSFFVKYISIVIMFIFLAAYWRF
jgi:hypothetical protein